MVSEASCNPCCCKIYVDTDDDIEKLQTALDDAVAEAIVGIRVEYPAYENENFDPGSGDNVPYNFIERSRYYVELGTIEQVPDQLPPSNLALRPSSNTFERKGAL